MRMPSRSLLMVPVLAAAVILSGCSSSESTNEKNVSDEVPTVEYENGHTPNEADALIEEFNLKVVDGPWPVAWVIGGVETTHYAFDLRVPQCKDEVFTFVYDYAEGGTRYQSLESGGVEIVNEHELAKNCSKFRHDKPQNVGLH